MATVKSKVSGYVGFEGQPVWLDLDQEVDADSPLVKAQPHLFTEPPRPAASTRPQTRTTRTDSR